LAPIVLADGQVSPANVTFTADQINGSIAHFNDGTDPLASQVTMQTSVTIAKKRGDFSVVSCVFRSPYVDSTTGAVLFYDQARVEYRFGYGSLLAKRKNLFAFVKNIHANALFKTLTEGPQGWNAG
jgi:hypothetical protein